MSDIAKLSVALYLNSAQFTSELSKSQKQAKTWQSAVSSSLSVAAKTIAASGAAAAAGIVLVYNEQAKAIDQTAKFADRLGVSTEALTQLRYASELTGVGSKNLDMSMQRMTRRIAEATTGSGEAVSALKQLGLDARTLGKMTPDQQMYQLADAFSNVESQSERVRLAFKLFDSEGVSMVNMLANGSSGLRAMASEADSLGITLSRVEAAKVEMANDALFKTNALTKGLKKNLTTEIAPYLAQLANEFTNWAKRAGGMNVVIADGVHAVANGVGYIGNSYRGVQEAIAAVTVAWDGFKLGFMVASQAIVTGLHELGQFIFKLVISPLQGALDIAGNFSDEAKNMANQLREFANQPAPELFSVADVNQAQLDLNQSIWELRDLASQPLPSDAIEQWYQNTKSKFDRLAKAYAASINSNNDDIAPDAPKEDKAVTAFREATAQMQTEWVRRLEVKAAGNLAEQTLEDQAYQDRQAKLAEQFTAAYDKAINDQALQTELEDSYFNARELLWQEHQANLTDIEKKQAAVRLDAQRSQLQAYSSLFGSMADIASVAAGEQSGIYKAMFIASKAFAIAESIIKIQQGIASAAALPFPANIPAMATVAASTASIVSTIQGTQLTGMSHDGSSGFTNGRIPQEGTWLLDAGQRVQTRPEADRSDALSDAVVDLSKQGSGSTNIVINLIEDASRAGTVEQSSDGDITTLDIRVAKLLQSSSSNTAQVMKSRYRNQQYGT